MEAIIKVENLSKKYVLSHQQGERYVALRDVMANRMRAIFGSRKDKSFHATEDFWALNDLSFEINSGERVGIIGRNGAGKSTLLKILSRITEPTKGRVTLEGRVGSLLEVGTGFHPELTGRENIFLNGSILGMGRREIEAKFDEIVAFAEVERFLDTPVKRYSSGMYVRLAFAVAAHLEPEILIVDEVLAVGDAAFQKKCLGKMEEVSGHGRTILFVSHNMQAIQKLCTKGMLLEKGSLKLAGNIDKVVEGYLGSNQYSQSVFDFEAPANDAAPGYVTKVILEDENGKQMSEFPVGRPWRIRIFIRLNRKAEHFVAGIGILSQFEEPIRTCWSKPADYDRGEYEVVFTNSDLMLTTGMYGIVVGLTEKKQTIQFIDKQIQVHISQVSDLTTDEQIVNTASGLIINQMPVTVIKHG